MLPLLLVLAAAPTDPQQPPPQSQTTTPQDEPAPMSQARPSIFAKSVKWAIAVKATRPTWERYFTPTGDCVGNARYPFMMQPRVCPVAVCPCTNSHGMQGMNHDINSPATSDGGNVVRKSNLKPWVKEFSSPAFIAYPRFDEDGKPVPGDGLIIYEGMRLTVDPLTGIYDLTFTATVPQMPVNLRLQLRFTPPMNANPETHCDYTLTLPPIRLEPIRDAKPGDPTAWTFHVAHRGYSTLFVKPNERGIDTKALADKPVSFIGSNWGLKRIGTARFGTPVAIEDVNR